MYAPYCKKRDTLQPLISNLKQEIDQKKVSLTKYNKVEEHLHASLAPVQAFRSKLPYIKDLEKFIMLRSAETLPRGSAL